MRLLSRQRLTAWSSHVFLVGVLGLTATALWAADFHDGFESVHKSPPRGLFHSAGPTRSGAPAALESPVSQSALVNGTLVRVAWSELHPAPGQFDFSLLEREFQQADALDSLISLGVLDGISAPIWLLDACVDFEFMFRDELKRACLPWDPVYLQHKQALLTALGDRFDAEPRLRQLYFTYAAMTNGIEMHWHVDEAAFAAAGYTPTVLAQVYADIFDMHVQAFPTTPISIEVHEAFDSPALAQAAYAHCSARLAEHCGMAIWWCAQRMTRPPDGESSVWPIAQQAALSSFLTCQTIGNFSTQPDRFDEGAGWTPIEALRNEMSFMYGSGVTHWELWSVDVVNSEFAQDLTDCAELLGP